MSSHHFLRLLVEIVDLSPFAFINMIPAGMRKKDIFGHDLIPTPKDATSEEKTVFKIRNKRVAYLILLCGITNLAYTLILLITLLLHLPKTGSERGRIAGIGAIFYAISWRTYKIGLLPIKIASLKKGGTHAVVKRLHALGKKRGNIIGKRF